MFMNVKRSLQRLHQDEAGITALETAIILIAFVVVASVFAFTILSAGTFSTERGKEAVYAGLTQVSSSMELKGSMVAYTSAAGYTATIDSLIFTLGNSMGSESVDLITGNDAKVVIEYRDNVQTAQVKDWSVRWKVGDGDNLLEANEQAEITVPITATTVLSTGLGINTQFALEIKPPSGAVLTLQRNTPAYFDQVMDLQ